MSTESKKPFLLDRLGGEPALDAAVHGFYDRVIADPTLAPFFQNVSMDNLKKHQKSFLRLAFTEVPKTINVVDYLMETHSKLFWAMGLNETHFDSVAGHFVETLKALNVPSDLIDEAVAIVLPLRDIFENGAKMAQQYHDDEDADEKEEKKADDEPNEEDDNKNNNSNNKKEKDFLFQRLGGEAAIHAAVEEFYHRVVSDEKLSPFFVGVPMDVLKTHQREFMKLAFTKVPDDIDVEQYMFSKHYQLFLRGLSEEHFDLVAGHFVGTLQHLGVKQDLIDESVGVIGPLRPIFVKGRELFQRVQKGKTNVQKEKSKPRQGSGFFNMLFSWS